MMSSSAWVGTNDVLNIRYRVSSFYIPIQHLARKAQAIFLYKVHFQDVIPVPNQPRQTDQKVYELNEIAIESRNLPKTFLFSKSNEQDF